MLGINGPRFPHEVPGYGPRHDRDAGHVRAALIGPDRFRARLGFVAAWFIPWTLMPVLMLLDRESPRNEGFWTILGVFSAPLLGGLWFAVVPIASAREEGLDFQIGAKRVRFPWSSLDWHPAMPYVGRYLLAREEDGVRRLPLWMLRRRDAERLFEWLDAKAGPPPVPRAAL